MSHQSGCSLLDILILVAALATELKGTLHDLGFVNLMDKSSKLHSQREI